MDIENISVQRKIKTYDTMKFHALKFQTCSNHSQWLPHQSAMHIYRAENPFRMKSTHSKIIPNYSLFPHH